MLLLPAILLAGLFGGIRVGLGAFVVCFLTAWIWFFPPYGTFVLEERDAVTIAAFFLTAALELYVIRAFSTWPTTICPQRRRDRRRSFESCSIESPTISRSLPVFYATIERNSIRATLRHEFLKPRKAVLILWSMFTAASTILPS